jgi:4-amino-4-deoxy-L-arabinose transferase-like glycosyltransferase
MRALPWRIALLLALMGIIASFVLLLGAFRSSPAHTIDIGGSGDAYVTRNFYNAEAGPDERFRWSDRDSALLLPETYTRASLLTLRLHGNAEHAPLVLRIGATGQELATLPTTSSWRRYQVIVPRSEEGTNQDSALLLSSKLSQPSSYDPRQLGVALDRVRIQPLTASGLLRVESLSRVLQLCWLLMLIGGISWLLQRALGSRNSPADVLLRSTAFSGIVALFLIGWAWRDRYTLDWLVPLDAGVLSTASALLFGISWASLNRQQLPFRACPQGRRLHSAVWIIGLALLSRLLSVLPLAPEVRGAAAYVAYGLPGALLALYFFRHEAETTVRLLLMLLGGFTSTILFVYVLQAFSGALTASLALLPLDLLTLACILLVLRQSEAPVVQPLARRHAYLPLILLLVLAAALRLPALGGAELHDDEASVLLTASRIYYGQDDVLLLQLKGPVQALLPTGPLVLTGLLNEWMARLPFAIAGLGIVLGSYVLARRCFNDDASAGLFAAAALTLDGFMIAFSRIVQYQSIVMLMTIGAIWCMLRFAEGGERPQRYLLAASLWISIALLSHYDGIYGLPALAILLIVGAQRRNWRLRQWLHGLAVPLVLGGGLLASFYLPFVLHPHFAKTLAHISERSGQSASGPTLYNNLGSTFELAAFYSTPFYLLLLIVALTVTIGGWLVTYARPRWGGQLYAVLLMYLALDVLRGRDASWLIHSGPLALLICLVPPALLLVAPTLPTPRRALIAWFGASAIAMLFFIAQPRTHVYVIAIPAALLVGYALSSVQHWLVRRNLRWLRTTIALGGVAPLLLVTVYLYALFVRQDIEYQRGLPATRLIGSANSAVIDDDARFGFPSRDGWKVIGELYRQGVLDGPFAANLSTEVSAWYTRGQLRCNATPEYYMVALEAPQSYIPSDAYLFGTVRVGDTNRIAIYSREQHSGPPLVFTLEQFATQFDAQPIIDFRQMDTACTQ